ncbi:MAG TPA: hypothetical protein VNT30_09245 [Stellaceae bacterium]|nr:hypothetical protein [Stellaceae bacterium]
MTPLKTRVPPPIRRLRAKRVVGLLAQLGIFAVVCGLFAWRWS